MYGKYKRTKKLYPWYVLVISDILLTSAILCTFCYFHHVRMLWGLGTPKERTENAYVFTRGSEAAENGVPPTPGENIPDVTEPLPAASEGDITGDTEPPPSDAEAATAGAEHLTHTLGDNGRCAVCGAAVLDLSGDFGASFPAMFIQNGESVTLSDGKSITDYALENGIGLDNTVDGEYIALYRSHNIFLAIKEVNGVISDDPVQYFIYDIYVRNIENLFSGYTLNSRYPADRLIEKTESERDVSVVAAVNGDYIANLNHCLLCERNGTVLRDVPEVIESDICVLYYDGTVETFTPSEYDWEKIKNNNPYQIWNFGPKLLDGDGNVIKKFDLNAYDNDVIDSRNPRTSFGYYEPGHYNLVVVDGRSKDSLGVRMDGLAEIQHQLGCKAAYNMDGGDSTQAYFMDTVIRESEKRDVQRKLSDIICVGEVSG